jgi:hypothetical protein
MVNMYSYTLCVREETNPVCIMSSSSFVLFVLLVLPPLPSSSSFSSSSSSPFRYGRLAVAFSLTFCHDQNQGRQSKGGERRSGEGGDFNGFTTLAEGFRIDPVARFRRFVEWGEAGEAGPKEDGFVDRYVNRLWSDRGYRAKEVYGAIEVIEEPILRSVFCSVELIGDPILISY